MSHQSSPAGATTDRFVVTPCIERIAGRALLYLRSGFPVNFEGPSGAGKTALALYVAERLARPVVLVQGDEDLGSPDFVGGYLGVKRRRVVDNFISSVLKTEDEITRHWVDSRLTQACRYGYTLVYDEFSRSRPEANNVLLSVLEEKRLFMPPGRGGQGYLPVHPDFRAIFTSNPQEYAGAYEVPSALSDRMVIMHLDYYDCETEEAIVRAKSGIDAGSAKHIVSLVNSVRQQAKGTVRPTIRASIVLATASVVGKIEPDLKNDVFMEVCLDVLIPGPPSRREGVNSIKRILETLSGPQVLPNAVPSNSVFKKGGKR